MLGVQEMAHMAFNAIWWIVKPKSSTLHYMVTISQVHYVIILRILHVLCVQSKRALRPKLLKLRRQGPGKF